MSFRYSGYVTAVVAALALALVLVSIAQPKPASAGHTASFEPNTITADGTTTLKVDLAGSDALAFIVATIDAVSTGTARFANSGQSIIVFNNTKLDTDDDEDSDDLVGGEGDRRDGIVLVNVTQGGPGGDSTPIQVAYTQTGAVASVQIFSTTTRLAVTQGVGPVQTVLTARVKTSTGASAAVGTMVTWQAVGQGIFTDTIGNDDTGVEETISTNAYMGGGGLYDDGTAGNSGCSDGAQTQSCISSTEFSDGGEVIETAEPEGSGQASVHFESVRTSGAVVWTARAGGVTGPTATLNGVVYGAVAAYSLARTGGVEFIRADGATSTNIVLTATDAAGNPVPGHVPNSILVTQPVASGTAATAVGAVNGSIPSCTVAEVSSAERTRLGVVTFSLPRPRRRVCTPFA